MEFFIAAYEPESKAVWHEVINAVNPTQREILENVELKFSIDETPLRFELRSRNRSVLTLTAGGLVVESNLADAYALYAGGYVSMEWLHEYIAYLRKQYVGGFGYYSATVLAGVGDRASGRTGPQLNKIYRDGWDFFRRSALFFTLAHEAKHAICRHSADQNSNESDAVFEQRIRQQEMAADNFAMNLSLKRKDIGIGFLMMLAATMYVYEPPKESLRQQTHTPDAGRIRTMALALQQQLSQDSRGLDKSRPEWRSDLQNIIAETDPETYRLRLSQRDAAIRADFRFLKFPAAQ